MSQSTPPPVSPVQEDKVSFVEAIRQYISGVVDLRQGVNVLATIREIKQRKSMEGANAWMLMCSIVIASIGLSQNSQAVIIGAMLISPLMSPILGIGLSVGINDMETLRSSAIHFGIAILIAVFTSTIYFALTPFDSLTPEIEARTAPTFLDIFIAVFGGLAGIISVARKDVSTTLPGVAIATALMPPLCVTGFGIATGSWEVATRSFYLFFLNTFFVALATYVIVRMLKFPQKRYVDQKRARSGHIYVILFALALTIPSFFIFRGVIKDLRTKLSLQRFVTTCLQEDKVYLDNYQLENNPDGTSTLLLKVYGNVISEENLSEYESCLANLGVEQCSIRLISTTDVDIDDVTLLQKDISAIEAQISKAKEVEKRNALDIAYLRRSHIDTTLFAAVSQELRDIFPKINGVMLSKAHVTDYDTVGYDISTVVLSWDRLGKREQEERGLRASNFLKSRLKVDSVIVVHR